jgi:metal-responsive CopG/Arc/MetJ family transcriptional regulator
MAIKVTFTLDEATVTKLNRTAERLSKPKSEVVREAVADYYERTGRLSESERLRMLGVLRKFMSEPATRPQQEVDKELRELRRARRSSGRLHPVD